MENLEKRMEELEKRNESRRFARNALNALFIRLQAETEKAPLNTDAVGALSVAITALVPFVGAAH